MDENWAIIAFFAMIAAIFIIPVSVGSCNSTEVALKEKELEEKKIELRIEMLKAGITNDIEEATSPDSD